mgnify:CR=1 FL=1
MEYLSVDRIENMIAVCEREDMTLIRIPLAALPNNVKEGSVLRFENGAYSLDANEEARRKNYILEIQNKVLSDD